MTDNPQAETTAPAFRDRIADALADAEGWQWAPGFDKSQSPTYQHYLRQADAVVAVLPETTDRAALLREAVDRLAELRDTTDVNVAVYPRYDEQQKIALNAGISLLRHMGGCASCEARIPHTVHCPTPETHNWGCGCPTDPVPADGPSRMADEAQQPETQAATPEAPPVCEGFQWIGQSFAVCERCGQPAWDHAGEEVAVEGAGVFDTRRTVRPWKPGQADAIRAKWEQPAAVSQPGEEA